MATNEQMDKQEHKDSNQEQALEQTEAKKNPLERNLTFSISADQVQNKTEQQLKRLSKTAKMPGFRPGKIPAKMIEKTYGYEAKSEAINELVQETLGKLVSEQTERMAGMPNVEFVKEDAQQLEFNAVYEVYPVIALADFSSTQIDRPAYELNEQDIDKTVDVLRKQRTTFHQVEREAKKEDRVVIDFFGTKEGEAFEGGTAEDYAFVLGAGTMLADFEQAVQGLTVNQEKTFDLTFPEDYQAKHLAGQTVQFRVVLKRVEEPSLPALDENFAKDLGIKEGTVDALRAEIRNNLERETKHRLNARIKEQIIKILLDLNPIDVPQALVNAEASQLAKNAINDMKQRGMNVDKMPVENSWFIPQAEKRVKLGLLMAEALKVHDLYAKPEQVKQMVEDVAQSYETPQELVKWYYEDASRLSQIEALVAENNVVTWVLEQLKVNDTPIKFEELMSMTA